MSHSRFQGASHGQPLERRVDAAYLQPCGFRFQLSRFLPAEHQRLLRRLVTWQLYEDLPNVFLRAALGDRMAPSDGTMAPTQRFVFTH